MRAIDRTFAWWRLGGGVTYYPYQIAFGLTFRYWPDLYAPTIRLHVGCFKVWLYLVMKRESQTTNQQLTTTEVEE